MPLDLLEALQEAASDKSWKVRVAVGENLAAIVNATSNLPQLGAAAESICTMLLRDQEVEVKHVIASCAIELAKALNERFVVETLFPEMTKMVFMEDYATPKSEEHAKILVGILAEAINDTKDVKELLLDAHKTDAGMGAPLLTSLIYGGTPEKGNATPDASPYGCALAGPVLKALPVAKLIRAEGGADTLINLLRHLSSSKEWRLRHATMGCMAPTLKALKEVKGAGPGQELFFKSFGFKFWKPESGTPDADEEKLKKAINQMSAEAGVAETDFSALYTWAADPMAEIRQRYCSVCREVCEVLGKSESKAWLHNHILPNLLMYNAQQVPKEFIKYTDEKIKSSKGMIDVAYHHRVVLLFGLKEFGKYVDDAAVMNTMVEAILEMVTQTTVPNLLLMIARDLPSLAPYLSKDLINTKVNPKLDDMIQESTDPDVKEFAKSALEAFGS